MRLLSAQLISLLMAASLIGCGTSGDKDKKIDLKDPKKNQEEGDGKPKDAGKNDKDSADSLDDKELGSNGQFANADQTLLNEVNFEKLTVQQAIDLQWLSLSFEMPGSYVKTQTSGNRTNGYVTEKRNVAHNWRVKVYWLGNTRGRAATYLNDERIDGLNIYVDRDNSTDAKKIYRYKTSGVSVAIDLEIIHDRAAGKCSATFTRGSTFSGADTLDDRSKYENIEVDCPKINRSIADERDFTMSPKWELTGTAYYDGYVTNPTYEVLARVESYELFGPWIRIYRGVDQHKYLHYFLDRDKSQGPIRHWTYRTDDIRSSFEKNVETGECTFTYTDAYFNQGMTLKDSCPTN